MNKLFVYIFVKITISLFSKIKYKDLRLDKTILLKALFTIYDKPYI